MKEGFRVGDEQGAERVRRRHTRALADAQLRCHRFSGQCLTGAEQRSDVYTGLSLPVFLNMRGCDHTQMDGGNIFSKLSRTSIRLSSLVRLLPQPDFPPQLLPPPQGISADRSPPLLPLLPHP